MTDKEKILEKLKKLLALSKSDNPHEASLALQRVQKLMQTYGITRDDIALSDIDESISNYWAAGSVNPPRYMLGLLGIIQGPLGWNLLFIQVINPALAFTVIKTALSWRLIPGCSRPTAYYGAKKLHRAAE
jgi:hypothetical protein